MNQPRKFVDKISGGFWFGGFLSHEPTCRSRRSGRARSLEVMGLESRLALSTGTAPILPQGIDSVYTDPSTGQNYVLRYSLGFPGVPSNGSTVPSPAGQLSPLSNIPVLNSYPGAKATIYLDFVGDYESSWGSYSQIATPAYDTDGDPTTLSAAELTAIQNIWSYVSEDYSPFNVNVTTVAPSNFDNGVALKIVIGGSGSWTGQVYGGVAYVGSFSNSMPNVVFVFPGNLGNGTARYTADAASHEAGHSFGLAQQSTYSGATLTEEYSTANVHGASPLMGYSYAASRSTWWYGTSDISSTSYQDDMAIIASAANGFGYRAESAGTTAATATFLFNSSNQISASGVILTGSDVNYYAFLANAGAATFTVQAAAGFNNLVPTIQLYDSTGAVLLASASAPPNGATATISTYFVGPGGYRLVIRGNGDYGNAGQYSLSGTISAPSASLFVSAPLGLSATAISSSQVLLTWVDNTANETGYLVQRSVNGGAWSSMAALPANSTSFADVSVSPGNTYLYQVFAYSPYMTSSPSNLAAAVIPVPVIRPPVAVSSLFVAGRTSTSVTLGWVGDASDSGYLILRSANNGRNWAVIAVVSEDTNSFTDRSVRPGRRYVYRITGFNVKGNASPSGRVAVMTPRFSARRAARSI